MADKQYRKRRSLTTSKPIPRLSPLITKAGFTMTRRRYEQGGKIK